MKKYHRICWYCGGKVIEDKGDYYQCKSCGATYTDPPTLGASPVTEVDRETDKIPLTYASTRYHPSGVFKAQATRARNK